MPKIFQGDEPLPCTFTERELLTKNEKRPIFDFPVETALCARKIGGNLFGGMRVVGFADKNSKIHVEEDFYALHRKNDAKGGILT